MTRKATDQVTTIGIDIGKNSFQALHDEAEYIDAGPLVHHENTSCNARSVHTLGQNRKSRGTPRKVRS